jgi:ABC-type antimicrobial peptide transport system permease subunit
MISDVVYRLRSLFRRERVEEELDDELQFHFDIVKLIVSKGVILAGIGVVAGALIASAAASMMANMLYGVRPDDLGVYLEVSGLFFFVAILASYLPARRATHVDPNTALREG